MINASQCNFRLVEIFCNEIITLYEKSDFSFINYEIKSCSIGSKISPLYKISIKQIVLFSLSTREFEAPDGKFKADKLYLFPTSFPLHGFYARLNRNIWARTQCCVFYSNLSNLCHFC